MAKTKLERDFQSFLIKDLKAMFPGAIVLKNDAEYKQGIPDLTILWNNQWATLEVKKSADEVPGPNQPYYVEVMNEMSFSAFIYPENREEVLRALQRQFGV